MLVSPRATRYRCQDNRIGTASPTDVALIQVGSVPVVGPERRLDLPMAALRMYINVNTIGGVHAFHCQKHGNTVFSPCHPSARRVILPRCLELTCGRCCMLSHNVLYPTTVSDQQARESHVLSQERKEAISNPLPTCCFARSCKGTYMNSKKYRRLCSPTCRHSIATLVTSHSLNA